MLTLIQNKLQDVSVFVVYPVVFLAVEEQLLHVAENDPPLSEQKQVVKLARWTAVRSSFSGPIEHVHVHVFVLSPQLTRRKGFSSFVTQYYCDIPEIIKIYCGSTLAKNNSYVFFYMYNTTPQLYG